MLIRDIHYTNVWCYMYIVICDVFYFDKQNLATFEAKSRNIISHFNKFQKTEKENLKWIFNSQFSFFIPFCESISSFPIKETNIPIYRYILLIAMSNSFDEDIWINFLSILIAAKRERRLFLCSQEKILPLLAGIGSSRS